MAEKTRLRASPYACKGAREMGVALEALTGTGPGGRIVRRDVEAAAIPAVKAPAKTFTETSAGCYATADVRELLAALNTLGGALTFPVFAGRAAIRLGVPLRPMERGVEGVMPTLRPGESVVLAVGDVAADETVRIHLTYDPATLIDGAAADLLRAMKRFLEEPLTMLL
ncbi:E3 binding domain-containing protein [Oscillibacter sp.]|uniref:E3 binding domain-containing protein n=1 Tax=Oscillibacter sp. TaxID=1945593 RepID=UPI00289B0279|nr:E3 binding domain-containing protein [Oscillibacter sp.]